MGTIMARSIAITSAAVAAIAAGSAFGSAALAHGTGHASAGRSAAVGHVAGGHVAVHSGGFMSGHHHFRHRFFAGGLAYFGGPYYDDCYARVWTRWGWRWVSVCY
jgi:hypothetical protein